MHIAPLLVTLPRNGKKMYSINTWQIDEEIWLLNQLPAFQISVQRGPDGEFKMCMSIDF